MSSQPIRPEAVFPFLISQLPALCPSSLLREEKMMLPSSVHAWLSPKNPLGRVDAALEQALGMPSPSGLRAPLRSRGISLPPAFPPSFLPSLPVSVSALPHTWTCLWKPPGERLCCGGGCRGAPAGDAPPYGAGYRGLTLCGLRGVCAPGEGLPKRPWNPGPRGERPQPYGPGRWP